MLFGVAGVWDRNSIYVLNLTSPACSAPYRMATEGHESEHIEEKMLEVRYEDISKSTQDSNTKYNVIKDYF